MEMRYVYKVSYDGNVKVYDRKKHLYVSRPTFSQELQALKWCE